MSLQIVGERTMSLLAVGSINSPYRGIEKTNSRWGYPSDSLWRQQKGANDHKFFKIFTTSFNYFHSINQYPTETLDFP